MNFSDYNEVIFIVRKILLWRIIVVVVAMRANRGNGRPSQSGRVLVGQESLCAMPYAD